MKKVLVIGLDGFEPTIVEAMTGGGELENLRRIAEQGGYSRLRTTYPAQTPVAWSTFATGINPGGHGIFDFITRDPQDYSLMMALNRFEQKNAFVPPRAVNTRKGPAIWDFLSNAGIASTVVRCPCTFPPGDINGRILAGVGVPDLRGGFGTSTFYSTNPNLRVGESERLENVTIDPRGRILASLFGPRSPKNGSELKMDIEIRPDPAGRRVTLLSEGKPNELEIRLGEWSDWLKVKFKAGLLQTVRGIARFYLVGIEPEVELYCSPVNFDPSAPHFPVSSPPEYAAELEAQIGTYYTTGMVEDHTGLNNGRLDESAYLDQCTLAFGERQEMMLYELDRLEDGLFFCLFDTPDRLQHMFWRFREPAHPALSGDEPANLQRVIEDHYRECDKLIGRVLEYVDDTTLLIVLSDHGMGSFQRGLHLNSWLQQNHFLKLKPGIQPGKEAGDLLQSVDWSNTKAYGIGLGAIYLNLRDREGEGIISDQDADQVKTEIAESLTGLRDPERDETAVRSVTRREQIYSGPHLANAPDLIINFAPGYRVSWETPLGGVPEGLFEDNRKKWSGDHVIDPQLVPGVLFMNRPFQNAEPSLLDLAPTVLDALGLEDNPALEGDSLL